MTPSKPCLDEPFVMCRRPLLNSSLPSSPSSGALQAPPCLERRRYAPFPFSNPPPLARPCCLLATASAGCSSPPPFLPSPLSRRRRRVFGCGAREQRRVAPGRGGKPPRPPQEHCGSDLSLRRSIEHITCPRPPPAGRRPAGGPFSSGIRVCSFLPEAL